MKKLLIVPLLILTTSVFAQNFQIGLKGGVNFSNFTGTTWENVDNQAMVGFHAGAFLNLLFGSHFSLSPEALFSTQGSRLKWADENIRNYKLTYLAVPVLLRYRFDGGFYLEAGPQFSFKMSENVDDQAVENFAKNLDLAFDAGLGYHSDGGFGIGARYVAGLSKVGDFDSGDLNPNFKQGVAQVFLFYTLFNNRK